MAKPKCYFCKNVVEFVNEERIHQLCDGDTCEFKSRYTYMGDDYVVSKLSHNLELAQLLVDISVTSLRSDDYETVFTPAPEFEGVTLSELRNMFLKKENLLSLSDFKTMKKDQQIYDRLGIVLYGYLRFVLKSNKLNLSNTTDFRLTSETAGKYTVYQINYDLETDTNFEKRIKEKGEGKSCFLFHGSPTKNWYSIMMNGVKNFSGTKRMVNGQAHGKGIYTSDQCNFAFGYSNRAGYSAKQSYSVIIGVFEAIGERKRYKKTHQIYVIPDENDVRMKYVISIKSCVYNDPIFKTLTDLFDTYIAEKKAQVQSVHCTKKQRRLSMEAKKALLVDPNMTGIRFEIHPASMYDFWFIYFDKKGLDPKSDLVADMNEIGLDHVKFEVRFPEKYPMNPPFIRVISPRFVYRSGHVTLGGSICMELLSNQGWSPVYSMETLLVQIKALILEGEGRLDVKNYNKEYTLDEARSAYSRMLHTHGWN